MNLIGALNDVASAVSSAVLFDDVLEVIVEHAKWVTNTEKAVLVLTLGQSSMLDDETYVVKGCRAEHPQEWWAEQLHDRAPRVFETGEATLDLSKENDAWLLCTPIRVKDHPVGLLAAINSRERKFSQEHIDFLAILSAFTAIVIEKSRLAEQSKHMLLVSERNRIAREMHDGISQSLSGVSLGLEVCKKLVLRDPRTVSERLSEIQDTLDLSRRELHSFIYDLRPLKLQELGLVGAIECWIYEIISSDISFGEVRVQGEQRTLSPVAEACLYRVAKESVSNVFKHAEASSFTVDIEYASDSVRLRVSDDGKGFDLDAVQQQSPEGSIGLRSIEERIVSEGGKFSVKSEPECGTQIEAWLPV